MKRNRHANQLKTLKQLTRKINTLLQTDQWDKMSEIKRFTLTDSLRKMYEKLKFRFSNRRLSRVLGAAFILVSTSASAQTFAPREFNPFEIDGSLGYLIAKPVFGDLDNDGDLDHLINNYYLGDFYYQENIGDAATPNFGPVQTNPFGLATTEYAILPLLGDIDGDGDLDILISDIYGPGSFIENIGTPEAPSFAAPVADPFGLPADSYSFIIDIADLDNDGDLDLIYSTYDDVDYFNNISFVENIGTATDPDFAAPVVSPFGMAAIESEYVLMADFGDIDDDGDLDFFRTNIIGEILFYHENTGDAVTADFSTPAVGGAFDLPGVELDEYFTSPELVDIDDDGDLDLFIGEYYGTVYFHEHIEPDPCADGDIAITSEDISCNGETDGLIEVEPIDLVAPITYDIGDGPVGTGIFPDLNAGEYTITVIDAEGCEYEETITVTEPDILIAGDIAGLDVTCFENNDGSIEILASGGTAPYTYDIGDGPEDTGLFIGLAPGEYTVLIIDANGCEHSETITISEPDALAVDFDIDPETIGDDGAIDATPSGGVPPYIFTWTGPDGFASSDEDISDLVGGSYNLSIVDANGCLLTITDVEVSSSVSIGELNLGLSIYPNPSNDGIFTLENEGNNLTGIRVMDLTGRVIYNATQIADNGIQLIDLSAYEDGTYIVELQLENQTQLKKVIKK